MEHNPNSFPHQGHIKDEPIDGYEQEPVREMCLAAIPREFRQIQANPTQPEGLKQTFYRDGYDTRITDNQTAIPSQALSSLPQRPLTNGNKFYIPPFRCLAETAGVGEYDLSLPPMMPRMQTRHEDRHIAQYLCQASHMPPDGAFLHSSNVSLRSPSWPAGQYELPHLPPQGNAYAPDGGHVLTRDVRAPHVLPPTVDPSSLLHRQFAMSNIQAESLSGSEPEMDNEDEPSSDWDDRVDDDTDDANGWAQHPDTIGTGVPEFDDTKLKGDMRDAAGVQVPVVIHARFVLKKKVAIQRDCVILYRRNYFGIQASYTLEPLPDSSPDDTLYLHRKNHERERIQAIYMCMRGVVDTEEGPEIKIVVFNAKRKPLHEGNDPPPIEPKRMKPLTEGSSGFYTNSTGDRQDHMNVPMNHTFHRNQFRAATQNNGARRTEQQFYHILLELKAEIVVDGIPRLFTIASKMSDSLVVRGRCPLSFEKKDNHAGAPDRITGDANRRGRKPPRRERGNGIRRGSTMQSQKKGSSKGASRGSCNKTSGGSRRFTRASANLLGLTHGTRSCNCDTAPVPTLPTSHANGPVNRQTMPSLGGKLLALAQGGWKGDRQWN